ncbi:MAG: cbb3-type cytochrome c oxidase subunit I [Acidimicrobiales bacterium]
MAITETRPVTPAPEVTADPERFVGLADHEPGGLAGLIGTGDHKSLGRAWIVLSLLFGVAGLVLVTLYHAHLANSFLPDDTVDQVATLGQTMLVLLFAIPLFIGIATYVSPLQVGARTVAFPRAAAMAFWGWALGSGILIAAYAINGGPGGGRPKAVDLSFMGLAFVLVSICIASICLVATIIAMRPAGLWMSRIPLFSWSIVVACSLWLFTLPVLVGNVLLVYVDHHYGTGSVLGTSEWTQLSWLFCQPAIFVVAIPALGAISDVLATLSGNRLPLRGAMMFAIGAFGVLSFGAWAQMSVSPDIMNEALYTAMGVLVLLPVLFLVGAWATTLRSGKPLLKSPLLFALSAALLVLLSAFGGAVYVIKQAELHNKAWFDNSLAAPPFATGELLLVVGASVVAALGALVYWSPKIFGRFANDGLAKLAALIALVGALLAGLPLMVYGFALKASSLRDADNFLNGLSAFGAGVLGLAVLVVVVALVMGSGDESPTDDAWGVGQSLEWATGSPPPPGNFGQLDRVGSAEPLLDIADPEGAAR